MKINSYSPEYKIFTDDSGTDFFVKRDDLIPDFFGGNKVRKNAFILSSMRSTPDVIITNGGFESNHARVCALMARKIGSAVHLVLHGSRLSSPFYNGNQFIISCTNSAVSYVMPDDISEEIAKQKSYYESLGKNVCVIPGGAHSINGAEAYMSAVAELNVEPDYIFLASGTGATQAGITAGVKLRSWNTKVIGISVARERNKGIAAIYEIYGPLCDKHAISHDISDIILLDEYRFGGYSKFDNVLVNFTKKIIKDYAIPLDPVYTGKAFFGMMSEVSRLNIKSGCKVLFWHTGGLLNLQSSKVI
ncbi:1-aminocyclopropane-1-carboxylate deaminase/D-cysteine desulfhydrase [Vibrio owensii]|uniref:1-aminocyclopropane-1-carboxylate deaminase/D-cysteine desulfhydrase n=1 Tax=Vibrio owensii TaxID=696485 RepID=UPI0005F0292F|nr:pyridoxal-phosphate dependent enzyme [Vibrio owensii]